MWGWIWVATLGCVEEPPGGAEFGQAWLGLVDATGSTCVGACAQRVLTSTLPDDLILE